MHLKAIDRGRLVEDEKFRAFGMLTPQTSVKVGARPLGRASLDRQMLVDGLVLEVIGSRRSLFGVMLRGGCREW